MGVLIYTHDITNNFRSLVGEDAASLSFLHAGFTDITVNSDLRILVSPETVIDALEELKPNKLKEDNLKKVGCIDSQLSSNNLLLAAPGLDEFLSILKFFYSYNQTRIHAQITQELHSDPYSKTSKGSISFR